MATLVDSLVAIIGLPVADYGTQYMYIAGAVVVIVVYSVFRLVGAWVSR